MSRYYMTDEEKRGYDAYSPHSHLSRYDGGHDYEQGWDMAAQDERRERERIEERRQEQDSIEREEERRAQAREERNRQEEQEFYEAASNARCIHGVPVDDDCAECLKCIQVPFK